MTVAQFNFKRPLHRPDIDGLRAIAVLSVVAFHAFPSEVVGGFIGVDVFFVISGYLISTIIYENLDRSTFSFAEFYIRRINRILPALLVVSIFCYSYGWVTLFAGEFKELGKHIAAGAAFTSNFVFWKEAGYFDSSADTKPLLHLWSLGIEEQFYLFWPLLLWFAWKSKIRPLHVAIVLGICSFLMNIREVGADQVAAFYLPHTRMWELLFGSVLAWTVIHKKNTHPNFAARLWNRLIANEGTKAKVGMRAIAANVLTLLGLALLTYSIFGIKQNGDFPGLWALMPVVGTLLVISSDPNAWVNKHFLSNKLVVWVGLISYPLYLWHWPLLVFVRIVQGESSSIKMRMAAVIASIILAWCTYRFIEMNFRRGGCVTAKALVLIFVCSSVGLTGYMTYLKDGFAVRKINDELSANTRAFELPPRQTDECLNRIGSKDIVFCKAAVSENDLSVALIGDSHAYVMYDYFERYFARSKRGTILLGENGCPPFIGVERSGNTCSLTMKKVMEYLVANKRIKDVYITARFAAAERGTQFFGQTSADFYTIRLQDNPDITDRREIFERGLSATLASLIKAGKNVAIILDAPELNFDPRACLGARGRHACSIDRSIVEVRQFGYRAIIERLRKRFVFRTYDLMTAMCDLEKCVAKFNGRILYRDFQHLGFNASEYLAQREFRLD